MRDCGRRSGAQSYEVPEWTANKRCTRGSDPRNRRKTPRSVGRLASRSSRGRYCPFAATRRTALRRNSVFRGAPGLDQAYLAGGQLHLQTLLPRAGIGVEADNRDLLAALLHLYLQSRAQLRLESFSFPALPMAELRGVRVWDVSCSGGDEARRRRQIRCIALSRQTVQRRVRLTADGAFSQTRARPRRRWKAWTSGALFHLHVPKCRCRGLHHSEKVLVHERALIPLAEWNM